MNKKPSYTIIQSLDGFWLLQQPLPFLAQNILLTLMKQNEQIFPGIRCNAVFLLAACCPSFSSDLLFLLFSMRGFLLLLCSARTTTN